jgi:Activator of Hsp90 ATPase homolog 1-like protein
MASQNFTLTLLTKQSPQQVFQAITNVRAWWYGYYAEEIEGATEKLNDEFTFRAGEGAHYSKHKLVEVIPDQKIVWLTTESDFTFIEKRNEWTGSRVIFDITKKGTNTQLTFTHEGLTPEVECYHACYPAWTAYLENKLLPLINTSKV